MSRTGASSKKSRTVEVRVHLPAGAHEDIAAMAKVSGLATSQYIRTLVMTHIAKIYGMTEGK